MPRGFLDTSVVVRYLTNDPPDMAARAARLIDSEAELLLTDGILGEAAYVLLKRYGVPRAVVVDNLIALVRKRNVTVWRVEKDIAIQALQLCRPSGRVSFADALLWSIARMTADTVVYSFDKRFPAENITLRQEPT